MTRYFLILFTVLTFTVLTATPAQAFLYPPNAVEASKHIGAAATAIQACDEAGYNRAMRSLKNLEKGLKAIAKSSEVAAMSSMTQNQAKHDWAIVRGYRQGLKARWENREKPCTTPKEKQASNTAVSTGDKLLAELRNEGCCSDLEERVAELEAMGNTQLAERPLHLPGLNLRMPAEEIADGAGAPLSTMTYEEEIAQATNQAESAISSCNRAQFKDAMGWLDELAYYADSRQEEANLDGTMDSLELRWRAAGNKPTCSVVFPDPFTMAVAANVGLLRVGDHLGYLGSEIFGGGGRVINNTKPDSTGTYAALNFGGQIAVTSMLRNILFWGTPNAPNYSPFTFWNFFFNVSRAEGDIHDNIGTIDPGNGRQILFPGTAVGPNGSGFQGGLNNPILNAAYNATYAWAAYQMGFGYMMTLPNSRFKLRPYGGVEYKRLKTSEELSGSIIGNDFHYQTNVREHSYAPFFGMEAFYRPEVLASLLGIPVQVGSNLRAAFVQNNASGTDDLKLGAFPTAPAAISNDDNSFDMKAELNLTFNPDSAFNVSVGGAWERTSVPMLNSRDGVRPSSLGREDVDNTTFMFRMNWAFGMPNMGNM